MGNPKKYWFKRKRYGWGWVPETWQGFAATIAYIVIVMGSFAAFGTSAQADNGKELGILLVIFILATTALVRLCMSKGPRPKWRWGSKPTDNPDEDE